MTYRSIQEIMDKYPAPENESKDAKKAREKKINQAIRRFNERQERASTS